jgi:hypothetical protein
MDDLATRHSEEHAAALAELAKLRTVIRRGWAQLILCWAAVYILIGVALLLGFAGHEALGIAVACTALVPSWRLKRCIPFFSTALQRCAPTLWPVLSGYSLDG